MCHPKDMHLVLPDLTAPARVILGDSVPMDNDEFFDFCQANPDLRIERTAQGEILIVPPAGGESDYRSVDLITQLRGWAKRDGRGKSFGSSIGFILPDNSMLSPDAAWASNAKIEGLSKTARKKFLPIVPDFVIEVMSPSDRLTVSHAKMEQWIANGTSLAWLVDGDSRTVYVYQPGGEPCIRHSNITLLEAAAGSPVQGFVADLADVWSGL